MAVEREFHCSDIKSDQLEKFKDYIVDYSTVLIHGDCPRGSGTFVKIGSRFGVLTADHVVNEGKDAFNFNTGSSDRLGLTVVRGIVHNFWIEGQYIRPWSIAGLPYGQKGPDMVFLEILDQGKLGSIKANRSFWDISSCMLKEVSDELATCKCLWSIAGLPEELATEEEPHGGFTCVGGLPSQIYFGAIHMPPIERENYDYLQMDADYKLGDYLPTSFGGLSGGGLWCIPLDTASSDSEHLRFRSPKLAGLVYYQTRLKEGKRRLCCHGPKSIYCRLTEAIQDT